MKIQLIEITDPEFAEIARNSKLATCTTLEGDGISKSFCIQNFEIVAEWWRADQGSIYYKVERSK